MDNFEEIGQRLDKELTRLRKYVEEKWLQARREEQRGSCARFRIC